MEIVLLILVFLCLIVTGLAFEPADTVSFIGDSLSPLGCVTCIVPLAAFVAIVNWLQRRGDRKYIQSHRK